MSLRLQLFGAPSLCEDGHQVLLSRRKAMALLAYLSITQSRHQRETLAALLWPESEASAAYSALRNVLWILRQTPLAELIRSDRSTVELLHHGLLEVDVNRFRELTRDCPADSHGSATVCAVCEPLLREAVDLCHGSFMSGFSVTGSIQYEDWQFAESEALKRELTETLDRMIGYYTSIGEAGLSIQYARQWIRADVLNEMGYRKLMQALMMQGNRAEALRVFAECSRILSAELGLAPEEATLELATEIRTSLGSAGSARTPDRPSSLPHALVPVIGRQKVSDVIEASLLHDGVRVLTIVGLGGSGKTCLALHTGRRIEAQFDHGACFVPLDAIRGENVVASRVAQALGIALHRANSAKLTEQIADSLRERNLLLILDGVEGVLTQVRALLPAVESAPGVTLLATSRIALGTETETIIPLHGLDYPEAATPAEEAAEYASVRLLRIAARRQGNILENDESDLLGMSRLARLLEGVPLGLEMAASWRSILSWDEIADRVSNNLEFLTHVRDDVPRRHRAFVAMFEQAWSMLTDEAQATLRRLSCFRSTFTIQAAEYVAESSPSSLAILVNRNLLKRVGPSRYAIHELLRQFASGKLGANTSEIERVHSRHSEYYLGAVATWFESLTGPDQYPALEQMGEEIGNVRAAFQLAAEAGYDDLLRDACEGLFFYYDMKTQFEEAAGVFAGAAKAYIRHELRDTTVEAFMTVAQGWFAHYMNPDESTSQMIEGVGLLQAKAPKNRLHAASYVVCGYAYSSNDMSGDLDKHIQRVRLAIRFYQDLGDRWGEGLATGALACLEAWRDTQLAEDLAYRSLRLHRETGDAWGEGLALSLLARLAEDRGDLELARERYEESQRLSEPIANDIVGVLHAIIGQSRVTARMGDGTASEMLAARALTLSRGAGYRLPTGMALLSLARARRLLGDHASATALASDAFSVINQRAWRDRQAECAMLLLELSLEIGDLGAAERWHSEMQALDPERDELRPLVAKLRALRKGG